MGTKDRREAFTVGRQLLSGAPRFSFIQAVRIMHLLQDTVVSDDPFAYIRVRPNLAWNTPPQEIIGIEHKQDGNRSLYLLTVAFLELYGAGSPLPMFYTQELYREQNSNSSVSRDFIDIFNGIFYELFFNVWKKYNIAYRLFESPDPVLWEQLYCIAGFGNHTIRKGLTSPQTQVTFSGLSSRMIRTAEGLRAILASLLGTIPVRIEQCVKRMATIPESQCVLIGRSSNVLGVDTIIGKQIRDRMGSFRVYIGPVTADVFDRFLPGSATLTMLHEQIRLYIDQPLAWDIEVICEAQGMHSVRLSGKEKAFLGWNTWIYSKKLPAQTVAVRFRNE